MQPKLQVYLHWLRKAAVYLAFIGFLSAKNAAAYGPPPVIDVPPLGATVHLGDTLSLSTIVALSQTPVTVKWYLNGNSINSVKNATVQTVTDNILGTTISTLTITNAAAGQAGNYTANVQNGGGAVTAGPALVVVLSPSGVLTNVTLLTSQCGFTNGGFQVSLLKPAQSNCVVEASSDFVNWIAISTNSSASTNVSYLDGAATNFSQRFYRARLQ
jgi:hypothetical protein